MYKVDERGSSDQRLLYQYLSELYPTQKIIYEFPLHEIHQRIDIYIPYLGIAIEYNGRQHYEYVEHFHKDLSGFHSSKLLDSKKYNFLVEKGIKLVYIPFDQMVDNKEELLALIENTPYPLDNYEILDEVNINKVNKLNKQREFRKKLRDKIKGNLKIDD